MKNIIVIPPAGKRIKSIIIQGIFVKESDEEKKERKEVLAKILLSFGFMDKK